MNCYKISLFRTIIKILILIAMLYQAIDIAFISSGGMILWASPSIPMDEWGKETLWWLITLEVILLLSLVTIIRDENGRTKT